MVLPCAEKARDGAATSSLFGAAADGRRGGIPVDTGKTGTAGGVDRKSARGDSRSIQRPPSASTSSFASRAGDVPARALENGVGGTAPSRFPRPADRFAQPGLTNAPSEREGTSFRIVHRASRWTAKAAER